MKKKIVMVAIALVLSVFTAGSSGARTMLISDANNKECPVTGQEITRKRFNTDYAGKRWWFSSFDALQQFKSNPQRFMSREMTTDAGGSQARTRRAY